MAELVSKVFSSVGFAFVCIGPLLSLLSLLLAAFPGPPHPQQSSFVLQCFEGLMITDSAASALFEFLIFMVAYNLVRLTKRVCLTELTL